VVEKVASSRKSI